MKKLFNIALALLCSLSMSAALTSRCFITLTSNQGGTDQVKIFENADSYTNDYVNGDDAQKNMNEGNPTNLNIYSIQGTTNVSEVRTNAIVNLPIIIETNDEGTPFTMTFKYVTGTIVLYDAEDPTHPVTLVSDGTYEFDLTAGRRTIANRFYLNYIPVSIKGADAWWTLPYDVDLTLSANGQTASGTVDFDGHAGEWYTFGVVLNGAWTGDNAGFTRADNSRTISGDQNMWFEIEDGTVDYVYTFTWTFATNTLTIGYPDAVPVPTCTTVRTGMTAGNYYTICLPKAVTVANGASFWNISNRGAGVAYLEEAQLPLVAGRPYIIQAEDAELCVEYSGDEVAAGAFGALHGTLEPMDQTALNAAGSDIYLLKDNELRLVSGQTGNSLAANRAYIKYGDFVVSTPNPAPGRRVRAIPMQDQSTTGVENLNAAEAPVKTVIDGKMYILRGKHMFDATGRMVK